MNDTRLVSISPVERAVAERLARDGVDQIRAVAVCVVNMPGPFGDEMRRGIVHAATEHGDCFAHELTQLFEASSASAMSPIDEPPADDSEAGLLKQIADASREVGA